jgi:hypothetical protein
MPKKEPSDLVGGVCEAERREQAWGDWVASLREWDLFGGLTFDPRRAVRPHPPGSQRFSKATRTPARLTEAGSLSLQDQPISVEIARSRARNFLLQAEVALNRRIAAVIALEAHRNGWPHFHPLLSIEGGLQDGDIRKLSYLWFNDSGYNRFEVPRDAGAVARYASKYLVKGLDSGDLVIWPDRGPMKFPDQRRLWQ